MLTVIGALTWGAGTIAALGYLAADLNAFSSTLDTLAFLVAAPVFAMPVLGPFLHLFLVARGSPWTPGFSRRLGFACLFAGVQAAGVTLIALAQTAFTVPVAKQVSLAVVPTQGGAQAMVGGQF